ncbi:protein translocase subunit SecD [Candidatus Uhrbacteria bacterium]|nr:protein translocase subunit SecD [Candidatus Uhrbacteria bacterium]
MAFLSNRRGIWFKVILLTILVLVATAYVAPGMWNRAVNRPGLAWATISERPFRLGLDLKGGTHLVYEADTSKVPDRDQRTAVEGVRDVIERRVNALGVAEPVVQLTRVEGTWRLIVELAGVYDTQKAIDAIGATPVLEFKEQNTEQPTLNAAQEKDLARMNTEAKKRANELLTKARKPGADFAALARESSEDPGSKEQSGDLGWFKRGVMVKEFEDAVFGAQQNGVIPRLIETTYGWHIITKAGERDAPTAAAPTVSAVTESGAPINVQVEGNLKSEISNLKSDLEVRASHILIRKKTATDILGPVDVWKYTGLGGKQLKRATLQFDPTTNEAEVGIEFDDEGSKLFAEITKRLVNQPIGIFIDGKSPMDTNEDGRIDDGDLYAPVVQQEITGGSARITGNLNVDTAKQLARRLQAGALPVPITILAQTTVGATLGEESIATSARAGLYGFALVALFMLLYYQLPGLLSIVALGAYAVLVLAVMKLLNATLTLAGIAGFVMSLGMAVDANVLIFERLREELRLGKSILDALAEAFRRAWSSIRDSNVTTLITCAILASFSTSVVKGFAITLAIGVLMSMFSAVTITRTLLLLVAGWVQRPTLYGTRAQPQANGPKPQGRGQGIAS